MQGQRLHKYMDRVVAILEGKDTKIKRSGRVLGQMARVAASRQAAFATLVADLVFFELEDRKSLQYIVTELFQAEKATIAEAFRGEGGRRAVSTLLSRFTDKEAVNFIGVYLRMFTDSSYLLPAWLHLDAISALLNMVIETDFNIQSEAIQTAQHLLITDRKANRDYMGFIEQNMEALLDLFSNLYRTILEPEEAPSRHQASEAAAGGH